MQDQPAYEFEPRIPPNLSIVAFGDVHGCLDKLDPLLERIEERAAAFPEKRHLVVSIGDLIDRGPEFGRGCRAPYQGGARLPDRSTAWKS